MTQFKLNALAAILLVGFACGAGCPQFVHPVDPMYQSPVVFNAPPTMQQLIAQVNLNTQRVQSLESTGATLGLRGFPSIRAQIYMVPPMKFRMIGETALTGQLLDIGSNETEFWVWGRGFNSPGLLYARHDEFNRSAAKTMLPVEPSWVAQAMGLPYFDPNDLHQGPYPTATGNYEIRTTLNSAAGQITKVTVIDKQYGYVLEQHMYDAAGQPIASALASNHRYDPSHGVSLPYKVDIRLPQSNIDFSVSIIGYRINQLTEGTGTFTRPHRPDVPEINLVQGMGQPLPTGQPLPSSQPYGAAQTYGTGQPYGAGQPLPSGQPTSTNYPANGQMFPSGQPLPSGNFAPVQQQAPPNMPSNAPQYPSHGGYPLGSNMPTNSVNAVRPVYETAAQADYHSPPIRGMR
ncbi:hypothetical protein GC197_04805 [bacterium]|nr:hypothetical protein [bacterium]